ncbi:MAG: spore coat associated protein CotJA [Lachnospiraceae bacterium]|nr:spore coat associated protein CotJA [Robinsoniella sp.]MDY3765803.1 spore coat associated protein CotJA [Lachnospiraceae bacterium]
MNYSSNCGCDRSRSFDQMELSQLPLAMAYVPMQSFGKTFRLDKALQVGTIFPELCLPFCGKRKGGKCV